MKQLTSNEMRTVSAGIGKITRPHIGQGCCKIWKIMKWQNRPERPKNAPLLCWPLLWRGDIIKTDTAKHDSRLKKSWEMV